MHRDRYNRRMLNVISALQSRHNGRDGVSNHQPHDCLLTSLFRRRSKKTSKLRVTGFVWGIHRRPFTFDDVIMALTIWSRVSLCKKYCKPHHFMSWTDWWPNCIRPEPCWLQICRTVFAIIRDYPSPILREDDARYNVGWDPITNLLAISRHSADCKYVVFVSLSGYWYKE